MCPNARVSLYQKNGKGLFLYNVVSNPLYHSKNFTLHPLANIQPCCNYYAKKYVNTLFIFEYRCDANVYVIVCIRV